MPRMIVVAGPPGGGKSTQLGADYFRLQQIPYFNIDDRCKKLHGSSKGIPLHIRNRANAELRHFCKDHFVAQMTFAYETTLRAPFAIEQSGLARAAAFQTELHFHRGTFRTSPEAGPGPLATRRSFGLRKDPPFNVRCQP